jgi:hypothetical protein
MVLENSDVFILRRSINPYVGLFMIFFCVTVLVLVVSITTHDLKGLVAIAVGWLFFALIVFIGTRYRITWSDEELVQRALGKKDVIIATKDITAIKRETSDAGTLFRFNRPFRRITVYSDSDFIDVSLKHFAAQDVRDLMQRLKAARPDLAGKHAEGERGIFL